MSNLAAFGLNVEELPDNGNVLLPNGTYNFIIEGCEERQTKDGTGAYLKLTMKVTDGEYAGTCVFPNLNIQNASEKAQNKGRADLKTICKSGGLKGLISDTNQLIGIRVSAVVEKSVSEGYGEQNNVRKYLATTSTSPTTASPTAKKIERPWG